jgi:hypothetical protein
LIKTKLVYQDGEYTSISYNTDNTPSKIAYYNRDGILQNEATFQYVGNQVLVLREQAERTDTVNTLILDNGLVTKVYRSGDGDLVITYNSNGNVTGITSGEWGTTATYSDVKSIFRHVGSPDWFITWFLDFEYSKNGYMLSGWGSTTFTYTTCSDGYALTRTTNQVGEDSYTITYEYINAN